MKKMMNWVLAATLVCGVGTFTSCSTDNDDNPTQEQAKKDRKEFIEHTRKNLKEVAENLNFTTWQSVNYFNKYFNQYVLLNDNFDKAVSRTFGEMIQRSMQPAPEGLAAMGKKYLATINFADFNYTFVSTETGFDVKPNDDEGFVMEIVSAYDEKYNARIAIKGTGTEYKQSNARMGNDSVQVTVNFAKHYELTLSTRENGSWVPRITASSDLTVEPAGNLPEGVPANGTSILEDAWNMKGNVATNIPGDATNIEFNIGQDPRQNKAGMALDYIHNGKKTIGLNAVVTNESGNTGAMSMMTQSNSILDLVTAAMTGRSIDKLQLTLLDDLTTTLKVTDCAKVMKVQAEMAQARRSYADQATIDGYVSELNGLISGTMSCKGVNQEIPMQLATMKVGVDWWTMPALKFADENGFVPIYQMLDQKSMEYAMNIIDHAAGPLQDTAIIIRQLIGALQKLNTSFLNSKAHK